MVQGGTQALSRSLFAAMVPKHQAAEFFGFYSTGAKFAGILGPLLFGAVSQSVGSRWGIVSIILFFLVGGGLLLRLNVAEAVRVAREAEAAEAGGASAARTSQPGCPRP
jgi:UMF1 family MFS transporter